MKRSRKSDMVWMNGRFLCYRLYPECPSFGILVENIVMVKPDDMGEVSACGLQMVNGTYIRLPASTDTVMSIINEYTFVRDAWPEPQDKPILLDPEQ